MNNLRDLLFMTKVFWNYFCVKHCPTEDRISEFRGTAREVQMKM